MNKSKKTSASEGPARVPSIRPKSFVFCERGTGKVCFEVNAKLDGSMPMEEATSLLALHCVMRNQMPSDFRAMIILGEDLVLGLAGPAIRLIQNCGVPVSAYMLSRRQQEVFSRIEVGLSNKEIGVQLCLSERTIKFHVSSLLRKFSVRGRSDLRRVAGGPFGLQGNPTALAGAPPLALGELGSGRTAIKPKAARPLVFSDRRASNQ